MLHHRWKSDVEALDGAAQKALAFHMFSLDYNEDLLAGIAALELAFKAKVHLAIPLTS